MSNDLIKDYYPDLITMTKFRQPNYAVIDFEALLARLWGQPASFLTLLEVGVIRQTMKDQKWVEQTCFAQFGRLAEVPFWAMNYYQKEVGIDGPKHSPSDEPVSIAQRGSDLILWNGYHRALVKILAGERSIKGYLLLL